MQFMQMKFHEEFHNLGRIQKEIVLCLLGSFYFFFISVLSGGVFEKGKKMHFFLFEFICFFVGMHIHGLAHAASGYHRVLEENRKLYNQVQDLKGKNITVFLLGIKKSLTT